MSLRDALLRGKRRPRRYGAGSPTMYRGDGYEFVELRSYVSGDDVRRIDWAASARSNELQTRVILEDVALTLAVIVDETPSMRVGRVRPLIDAAHEAADRWMDAARAGDKRYRIGSAEVLPNHVRPEKPFVLERALVTAQAALTRGSALLVISDFFDLADDDEIVALLGARFDCTALVARDPWYDGLPLHGIVRIQGAEGGSLRTAIGARQRAAFLDAVRAREARCVKRLERCGWRVGILTERHGGRALERAFGIRESES